MIQNDPAPTPQPSASSTPDRATTFRAVEGGAETQSGALLMVEAYSVLWLILFAWLVWLWRRQASLHASLDGLEKAIDRAAAKAEQAARDAGTEAASAKK
jgi:hypothetical protein